MKNSSHPACTTDAPIVGLIADVGGTNVRLAFAHADNSWSGERVYRCEGYSNPTEIVRTFQRDTGVPLPSHIALCVAGPITGDDAAFTNLGWHFSIEAMRRDLGVETLNVVNDFVANALACPRLPSSSLVQIGQGATARTGYPIAAIGPGTGLGTATLVPDNKGGWIPVASEGGHVTLAASNQREWDIICHLRQRSSHVSGESTVCGSGLESLFRAIRDLDGLEPLNLSASEIAARALGERDPCCREALEIMCAMLGTLAGNLALTTGALGGVYVLGGILPRMVDFLQESEFRNRFENKGRLSSWVRDIPTWLVTHPFPAFPGLIGLLPEQKVQPEAIGSV